VDLNIPFDAHASKGAWFGRLPAICTIELEKKSSRFDASILQRIFHAPNREAISVIKKTTYVNEKKYGARDLPLCTASHRILIRSMQAWFGLEIKIEIRHSHWHDGKSNPRTTRIPRRRCSTQTQHEGRRA